MSPSEAIEQAEWQAEMIVNMTPVFARCHLWPTVTPSDWEPVERTLSQIADDLVVARADPALEDRCLAVERQLARGDVGIMCLSLETISRVELVGVVE